MTSQFNLPDNAPGSGEELPFDQQSLTPKKVLMQMRLDVISVLGLQHTNGKFTALEERLIQATERIVRKAHCPSLLIDDKQLHLALRCLKRRFPGVKLSLEVNGQTSGHLLFESLCDFACEAAHCQEMIKGLRRFAHDGDTNQRKRAERELTQIRARATECLKTFQLLVFEEAERLREAGEKRTIHIRGTVITLDRLISAYRSAAKKSQEPGSITTRMLVAAS